LFENLKVERKRLVIPPGDPKIFQGDLVMNMNNCPIMKYETQILP